MSRQIGLALLMATAVTACGTSIQPGPGTTSTPSPSGVAQRCLPAALPSAPLHGSAPTARMNEAIASDASGKLILYGGEGVDGSDLFDTWTWDGRSWIQVHPPAAPRLYWPLMTLDAAHHQLLLVGATIADPTQGSQPTQTWIWTNGSWQQVHPAAAPNSYGADSSVAYDAATGRVLLYADIPRGYVATHEMWSWDGKSWSDVPLPSMRFYLAPQSIVSAPDGGVLGLGAVDFDNVRLGTVYAWTGASWQGMNVSGTPPSVRATTYDPNNKRVVIVGSLQRDIPDAGLNSDSTFTFDGKHWAASPLPPALMGRVSPGLAWDAAACTVVLWGGVQSYGNINLPRPVSFRDTWYKDGSSWVRVAD